MIEKHKKDIHGIETEVSIRTLQIHNACSSTPSIGLHWKYCPIGSKEPITTMENEAFDLDLVKSVAEEINVDIVRYISDSKKLAYAIHLKSEELRVNREKIPE